MKKIAIVASLMACCAASPAFAQDDAQAGTPAERFSGPRIEGRIGYDIAVIESSFDDGTEDFAEDANEEGLTLGGELGFDIAAGSNFVAGGYVGADYSSVGSCSELFGQDEACVRTGLNLTAGGRVGAVLGNNVLVYAKGGYSRSKHRSRL